MDLDEIPTAMIEAVGVQLYGMVLTGDFDGEDARYWERTDCDDRARELLAAALAGCEVGCQYGVAYPRPERTGGWTHWWFGSRAECEVELNSLGARAIGGKLVRRLLITTPPEDVP